MSLTWGLGTYGVLSAVSEWGARGGRLALSRKPGRRHRNEGDVRLISELDF